MQHSERVRPYLIFSDGFSESVWPPDEILIPQGDVASAKEFLLAEGTDVRYGARPLKRAIERLLVHPLSNLMATRQIRRGDYIRVSHPQDAPSLRFSRETQAEQAWGVASQAA